MIFWHWTPSVAQITLRIKVNANFFAKSEHQRQNLWSSDTCLKVVRVHNSIALSTARWLQITPFEKYARVARWRTVVVGGVHDSSTFLVLIFLFSDRNTYKRNDVLFKLFTRSIIISRYENFGTQPHRRFRRWRSRSRCNRKIDSYGFHVSWMFK